MTSLSFLSSTLSGLLADLTSGNLFAQNLLAWAIQVTILTGAGVAAERLLRAAKLRLYLWQAILAIAVLLPLVQPWTSPPPIFLDAQVAFSYVATPVVDLAAEPAPIRISLETILMGGVLLRLLWLAIGVVRLGMLRRGAVRVDGIPAETAPFLFRDLSPVRWFTSEKVHGPVTFGWPSPCILLPQRVLDLPADQQRAIAQHELVHADRNDWLFVIAEELVRAALWFHPAVWFALAKIGLAREQVVDQEVVALTENRDGYLNALVSVASSHLHAGSAPAPLFLKRRQLAARIAAVLKETPMQSVRAKALRVAGAAALALLLTGAGIALFPLMIEAQLLTDAEGVTVDPGAPVLHRTTLQNLPTDSSFVAILDAELAADGNVTSVTGISGPKEYMQRFQSAVSQWHYVPGPRTARVMIQVEAQDGATAAPGPIWTGRSIVQGDKFPIRSVWVFLPARVQDQVERDLSARIGETWTLEEVEREQERLRAKFDPTLFLNLDRYGVLRAQPERKAMAELFDKPRKVVSLELNGLEPDLTAQVQAALPFQVGGEVSFLEVVRLNTQLQGMDPGLQLETVSMNLDEIRLQVNRDQGQKIRNQKVFVRQVQWNGDVGQFKDEIERRMPVKIGGEWTIAGIMDFQQRLRQEVDSRIYVSYTELGPQGVALNFRLLDSKADALHAPRRIASVRYVGLPQDLERQVKQRFPVAVGATVTLASMEELRAQVRQLDEHLTVVAGSSADPKDETTLNLTFQLAGSLPPPPPPPPPNAVHVGGGVIAANLLDQTKPVYPPEAKAARIQGKVVLRTIIDETGHVTSVTPLEGNPALVDAAREAVEQWVYQPTLLNGTPVSVVSDVEVNFSLSPQATAQAGPPPLPPPPPPPAPVTAANTGKTAPRLIYQVAPELPPIARQAKIQGKVMLSVTINEQGTVEEMHVVSGHPMLVPAAMDAVRQWVFEPGTKNGVPVPVRSTVEVSFRNL